MRSLQIVWACLLVPVLLVSTPANARTMPGSFADLVERLSPAVVNISTSQKVKSRAQGMGPMFQLPDGQQFDPFREFFEQFSGQLGQGQGAAPAEKEVQSLGSGFVIDKSGYVVTNNHVVAEADEVTVTFANKDSYDAKIIGRDAKTDLALLKIEAGKDLPFVKLGNSDGLRVGDWVVAIGNPFGLGGSVSAGIVSARSRNINAGPFDDFIQTDAAINRGNSGGPLFDINGNVIGINTAIFSPTGGNVGIGFALPAALAEPVLDQLRQFGRTYRGWLGVKIQEVTDEIADSVGLRKARGAMVLEIIENGPAEDAGLKAGDIILSFAGKPVKEMRSLPRLVAETKQGTKVALEVWRGGKARNITVKLGELEEEDTKQAAADSKNLEDPKDSSRVIDMKLVAITDAVRRQFRMPETIDGLLVLEVKAGSAAAKQGIRRFDVVKQANQKDMKKVSDLATALSEARKQGRKYALLRVSRRGEELFVTVPTE